MTPVYHITYLRVYTINTSINCTLIVITFLGLLFPSSTVLRGNSDEPDPLGKFLEQDTALVVSVNSVEVNSVESGRVYRLPRWWLMETVRRHWRSAAASAWLHATSICVRAMKSDLWIASRPLYNCRLLSHGSTALYYGCSRSRQRCAQLNTPVRYDYEAWLVQVSCVYNEDSAVLQRLCLFG